MSPFSEKSDEELDAEFIKILRLMKPYITCIMNNHYIELVRLWLEKLSDANFNNKMLRNKYLVELGKQIEAGIFEEPFTDPPPSTELPPYNFYLDKSQEDVEKNDSCFLKYDTVEIYGENIYSIPKLELPLSEDSSVIDTQLMTGEDICNFKQECSLRRIQLETIQNTKKNKINSKLPPNYDNFPSRQSYSSPILPRLNKNAQKHDTESSWYDLTETVLDTAQSAESKCISHIHNGGDYIQASAREYYEEKICNLLKVIEEMKEENIDLKKKMEQCQRDLNLRNTKAETSIHKLIGEVTALKKRFQDLVEKSTFATNNFQSPDRPVNLSNLQSKLQETLKKNLELRSLIIILEKKFRELVNTKTNKSSTIKKKLTTLHAKEIEKLREMHATTLKEMRETLTKQFQNQLSNLKTEYEKELKYKNDEIDRLEHLMKEQCQRMQNEVKIIKSEVARENTCSVDNEQKVLYLQKCILKLEKLFNKSEKDYLKQISKLKYELEIKNRANKLALSKQKAEVLLNTSTNHQKEIDTIVNTLEDHYKELLRKHQEQATQDHLRDTETIQKLQEELKQYQKSHQTV